MLRAFLPLAVLAATAATAAAGPKKKVRIETTPPGASVYVDAVEEGEKCKTPCPIEVDPTQTVIIALAGHKEILDSVVIGRSEKPPYKRAFTLVPNVGTIAIKGPAGARVYVDDEDKGKAPVDIEVGAGVPHSVIMKLDGKQIYAESVEVAPNDSVDVTGSSKTVAAKPDDGTREVGTEDNKAKPDGIRDVATPRPRSGPIIAVSAAFSIGFRDFDYQNADLVQNPNLNPAEEYGQVTGGVLVELWPGTLAGVRALRGTSLLVRYQHNVNSQVVNENINNMEVPTDATTFWRTFEASAKQRWTIKNTAAVEVGAGYMRDEHTYGGGEDRAKVPDVSYESVRIGGRASLLLGKAEPYASVENLIVLSGGELETRFPDGASANGLKASVGLGARFGSIGGRLEGSITRYTWTFEDNGNAAATGATDSIKHVSLMVGYAY